MKRNLHILYAISLLQGMVFYSSVATLYRTAHGMTLGQITLIESISMLLTLALELPWGVLADRIGYRRTMIACSLLFLFSKIVFYRASGSGMFLLERILLSAAIAGLSGVDSSMLYLSAPQGQSQRAFGIYSAAGTAGLLFSSLIFTFFIGENYSLAALLTVLSHAVAAVLSFGLREVRTEKQEKSGIRDLMRMLRETLCSGRFLLLLICLALMNEGLQMATVWFNQPQYERCAMSVRAISAAYIAVTVLSLSAPLSKPLTDKIGPKRLSVGSLLLCAAAAAILAGTSSGVLSFICIALIAVLGSLMGPLVSKLCSRRASSEDRATQLSIFSIVQSTSAAGADLLYGRAADRSLGAAFIAIAVGFLIAGAAFCLYFRSDEQNI